MKAGGLTISRDQRDDPDEGGRGQDAVFDRHLDGAADGEEKLGFYYKGGYLYLDGGPGANVKCARGGGGGHDRQ